MRAGDVLDPFGLLPLGQRVLARAADEAGRATVGAIARAVASPHAEEALDAVLRSRLPGRAVGRLVDGPLVDAAVEAAVREHVVERIVDALVDRGAVEQVAESVAMERLMVQILDSHLVEAITRRVLASDELWLLVDEIAQSPAVTDAIAHQGAGVVDQVAEDLGRRSRDADARLEGIARRLLHRKARPVIAEGT